MQNKLLLKILLVIILTLNIKSLKSQEKDVFNFSADKITYSQDNNIIEAAGNVLAKNEGNSKKLFSDKIIYNKSTRLLKTFGNSKFEDSKKQTLFADNFEYDLEKNLITAEHKVKFLDNKKNIYYFSKAVADDKFNEIIGYDLDSSLNKEKFKSKDKFNEFIEPRLSGKQASIKDNITLVKDGKFTSCKRTSENDGSACWNLNASEIIHDKDLKEIIYKNATLDLNNTTVLYAPYFDHPDPTVKRESGFLAPSFSSLGKDIGTTIKTPYFYPFSESKDMTISPVYYFKQNPLILGEYREKFKNGDFSLEGGFTEGYKNITSTQTDGSRHHLYANLFLNYNDLILEKSIFNAKVQDVSNPTYLKVNKINSVNDGFKKNLIKESDTQLTNEVYLNSFGKNETLNIRAAAYQNISVEKKSDQYQYILPDIAYSKYKLFDQNLNFNTNFRSENANTNQNKTTFINNLDYNTNESYSDNGIAYKFLTKINNINYYSDYRSPKENLSNEINPIFAFDTSLPFAKISNEEDEQYLIPRLMTRYSPGKMANQNSNTTALTTDNIFSINRMNSDEIIEKNLSINIGIDWSWQEKFIPTKNSIELEKGKSDTRSKAGISVGEVIKFNRDQNMPNTSSLQNKTSDIVTKVNYLVPKNFDITLRNTIDNQFNSIYYSDLNIRKFLGTGTEVNFNYYEKNNYIGNERYAKANFVSDLTNNTKLTIETDRNLKTDITNSHKFTIENQNECIKYGLYIQKTYSSDKDLRPATNILFGITLLPFGENYTSGNLIPSIGGKSAL
jgi:LPS-assembly protein